MGTQKQKANTVTSANIQHNESVGGSNLKEKTNQQETHGIIGTYLRRHLGLGLLLLWHSGRANITPHYVPWNQLWWQKHIMLALWCYAHRGGSHYNSHSDGWFAGPHNCHRWSSSGCRNWRHNVKHATKKFPIHLAYIQQPWGQGAQLCLVNNWYIEFWQTYKCTDWHMDDQQTSTWSPMWTKLQ